MNNSDFTTLIKRYWIPALYILTLIVVMFFLRQPIGVLTICYLVLTAALILLNLSSVIAIVGNYNYAAGREDRAARILKRAIDMNTKSPMAYLNYAIYLVRKGEAAEALGYLQKAESLNPKVITDKNVQLTMGSCYWVLGEVDKAIEVLEKLREKYSYVNVHVLTTLGYMYHVSGDEEKAMEITELALLDDDSSGSAWDNKGQILYAKREIEGAREAFLKAIECKNDLCDSYYFLGLIAADDGDRAQAGEYFNKASKCKISSLNTVTKEQIEEKCAEFREEIEAQAEDESDE